MTTVSAAAVPVRARNQRTGGALARWLLDGPAQLPDGRHRGAVAGCITASGAVAYVYPEITGYYLQWLAWRAANGDDPGPLIVRAEAAQQWLGAWLSERDPPRTRIHLDETVDDWRNGAVFCFDLAMVLRGIASAARARLLAADPAVISGITGQLERLVGADGEYEACVPHPPGTTLPDRWSTRRGPFLAKAAAGIVRAARSLPGIPGDLERAATRTFDTSIAAMIDQPHRETHPLLYAVEGFMALPEHPRFERTLTTVAAQFDAVLARVGSDGRVPETLAATNASPGPARVDVLAQLLRMGHLLAVHRPGQLPDQVALARLRNVLEHEVRSSGAVGFTLGIEPADCNVWAAMFSDQALAFATSSRTRTAAQRVDPMLV